MTQPRPTLETDRSGRLASRRSLLVAVGLAVVVCSTVLAGGVAGMSSGDADTRTTIQNTSNETNLTYPPPNLNTTVKVYPGASRVEIQSWYSARTMTERRQYRNKTGNVTWFKTHDALRHAFRERGEHLSRQRHSVDVATSINNPKLGEIYVDMRFEWNNGTRMTSESSPGSSDSSGYSAFSSNQSKLILGPALSDHLSNGTVVRIEVPADTWIAENSTVPAGKTGIHWETRVYAWTVNQTETEPRVVFNRSVLETESADGYGSLGPAGGLVLSLLAVFLAVGLQSRF
ncbi:hypothetical protein Huta_0383 [Halorhabdus utahensis DSM 12940]|uniref:Uncharacterized protein n=2 Tax=Halorhabdus utahensis TaxID=146826 RepID=C7NRD3_HALUD|nr:hypothetical protein Huta_0383 [Halorhabdus utahensis DSM 12940]